MKKLTIVNRTTPMTMEELDTRTESFAVYHAKGKFTTHFQKDGRGDWCATQIDRRGGKVKINMYRTAILGYANLGINRQDGYVYAEYK